MKYYKITSTFGRIEETKLYYKIAKDNGFNVRNLILENYGSKFEIEINSLEDVIKLSKLVKEDIIIITNDINNYGETSLEIYDDYGE